ncbi:MAG: alpha/beta hydrolase [Roseburia sp.]|nr:alpha/beta hydrolase [Roseburia sp.]
MFYNAKNGNLKIGNTDMDYISFGTGKRVFIMIPGLGDGMMTVKGKALPFAWEYRKFAKDFTVYLFSRKNELEEGYSIRDMARDLKIAMDKLRIEKADIMGVSQGGMIAEYMAIDYPEVVNKLILVVTVGRQNECIQSNVKRWIELAEQNRYGEAMKDITVRMYTPEYIQRYRLILGVLGLFPGPKNKIRFLRMAKSCAEHSLYEELREIKAPTLIVGGERDQTVTGEASKEIAEQIDNCELYMYAEYGHGLYSEAKDFNQRVYDFLLK